MLLTHHRMRRDAEAIAALAPVIEAELQAAATREVQKPARDPQRTTQRQSRG